MVRDDRSVRMLLALIAVLLSLNIVVSVGGLSGPRTAVAAAEKPGDLQMQPVVDRLNELGRKMDKLQAYLESGNLSVNVNVRPKQEK